jgi:hypothetical protein
MSATFTDGVWIAKRRTIGELVLNWQVTSKDGYFDEKGKRIAIAVPSGPNAEGNAKLISKAPRMYHLLEDILHQLSTDSDLETIAGAKKYGAIIEQIKSVIEAE